MITKTGIEAQIMEILQEADRGLGVEEIADKLSLTRHTVAKYLEVLQAKGAIHHRRVGRAKLWREVSAEAIMRPLTVEDMPVILQIEERIERELGLAEDEVPEYFQYNIDIGQGDPPASLGAEVDGELVGFIIGEIRAWEFGHGERVGWIRALGVDPRYQGRGIGRRLGEELLRNFRMRGIKRVRTMVDWYAGELISYFKSFGFELLNMIPLEKRLE